MVVLSHPGRDINTDFNNATVAAISGKSQFPDYKAHPKFATRPAIDFLFSETEQKIYNCHYAACMTPVL